MPKLHSNNYSKYKNYRVTVSENGNELSLFPDSSRCHLLRILKNYMITSCINTKKMSDRIIVMIINNNPQTARINCCRPTNSFAEDVTAFYNDIISC